MFEHLLLFYSFKIFSHQRELIVLHWSSNDSKSLQVSRTLLSILADLNYAFVWMVSTRPLISEPSSPFINPLVTVPSAPITIGIIVTFMLHIFFSSLVRTRYLSLFSVSFGFTLWSARMGKSTIRYVVFFLFFLFLFLLSLGLVRWSVYISKSQRNLCVSFSRMDSGLCIYHLFVWLYFNFLLNSQWITFPTQSCLVLYSFCVDLLHSLVTWLIVSSPSPHNLNLLLCCILFILALI